MSKNKTLLHVIWPTKKRIQHLKEEILPLIIDHILENAKRKGIIIVCINGYSDHLHCLIRLNPLIPLAKTIQLIKGESSHWINKQNLLPTKFEWSNNYYAVWLNETDVPKVKEYIENQYLHHKKKTFTELYKELMVEYGFKQNE